jgi:Ser/Thr protein kinase RdoA (MazF antagonist)
MPTPDVNQILRRYPHDCQPAQVELLGWAGGMSGAQFWRVATRRGTLCLRRWPIEHPSPQRLAFIHAVLQHAARRGISFIPVPITTHSGASFVHHAGHLWQLEPWMPGAADYEKSPRIEKLRAAMTALARLHVATSDLVEYAANRAGGSRAEIESTPPQSAVVRRVAQLRELSTFGINELSSAINEAVWPEFAPLAREFIARLPTAVSSAIAMLEPIGAVQFTLQPCLRDVWHDHILFAGDEVTGIVDFGAVDFDTPATDIARLLGSLVADDVEGWRTGLDVYSEIRPLSPEESLAMRALDKSGTLVAGCNWIRWVYIDGRRFPDTGQIVNRFRRLLSRVMNWQGQCR